MNSPRIISREEISGRLDHTLPEYFRALSGVSLSYGKEHSAYIQSFMEKSKDHTPKSLLPMFKDEGRFSGEVTLKEYWKAPLPYTVAGKLIESNLLPSINGLGKIKDMRCFIGKKGDRSSLHFDWNPFPNYLLNLSGTKRITLYPPEASKLLRGYANFSMARPESGKVFELNEGEALLIPTWWWHEVQYITKACSLSLRIETENSSPTKDHYPSWKFLLVQEQLDQFPWGNLEETERKLNSLLGLNSADDHPYYLPWVRAFIRSMNGVITS